MTITRDLFALLGSAIIMGCLCGADRPLPEVTGVSYKWLDPFVLKLNWSWMRPEALPKSCQVKFNVKGENKDKATTELLKTGEEHVDICYLTKSPATTHIYIHVCAENCSGWTMSETVNKTIEEPNHTELVKDFKCLTKSDNMSWTCTWTPVHPSLNLSVSYRKSGKTEKDILRLTPCHEFITTGEQRGCHVRTDPQDIWVLVKSDSQTHIFTPRLVVPLPNVTLKEDGHLLRVTWHPPKVGKSCKWIFNMWYEACHKPNPVVQYDNFTIPYDKCCIYKLRYNVSTGRDCPEMSSDNSPILTYGQPCFSVATAVTIIIPIIVFIFVLLSCYCFRRYKDIICPIVPVPLDLFKGLVTGNRDITVPVVPLYTPVESIESCKITLIPENKVCAVEPVGKPLTSNFHKEIVGVLQRFTLKEHKLVWSNISRIWMDTEQILHQRVNIVPFILAGLDNTTVKVQSPLEASGVHTEITNEKFHQASYSLGQLVLQYLSGEKPKGHLEIEEMLKVGTTLTGIGELILDTDGTVCLRPPSDNSQYFLSMADFEILRREYDSIANWWKALTIASALAGAAALFWVGLRFYRHLKDRWEQEQESREFERRQAESLRPHAHEADPDTTQNGAENNTRNVCVICLSQPRDCILLDCGHVCCCYVCFQSLPQRRCPVCRQNIVRVLPFFQS